MPSEWYESFFTPLTVDFWRAAVSEESTSGEVDFLIRELDVQPRSRLLDLPTGAGRHALMLAKRQYDVTGVDISGAAISAAKQEARARRLAVHFQLGDMRDPPPGAPYDGSYCFGNSFGYLSDEDTKRFVKNSFHAVRPGARWAIDMGTVAESLLPHLTAERTLEAGGVTYSVRSTYNAAARRLVQICKLERGHELQTAEISYSVYSLAELRQLLQGEGWQVVGCYGALDGRSFEPGDRRLLLVARRPRDSQ